MPTLISSSGLIEDVWTSFSDNQAIDDQLHPLVSLDYLRQYPDWLSQLSVQPGVIVEPTLPVEDLLPFLDHLAIIILQFRTFIDGRAFSQARLLRDRYDFRGDLRAVGEVLCDQLRSMQRSGFNQFELAEGEDLEVAQGMFDEMSVTYQVELK